MKMQFSDVRIPSEVRDWLAPTLQKAGYRLGEQVLQDQVDGTVTSRASMASNAEDALYLVHLPRAVLESSIEANVDAVGDLEYLLPADGRIFLFSVGLDQPAWAIEKMVKLWHKHGKDIRFVAWRWIVETLEGDQSDEIARILRIPDFIGGSVGTPSGTAQRSLPEPPPHEESPTNTSGVPNGDDPNRLVRVFVSYEPRNDRYVTSDRELLKFLQGLERDGFVFWCDKDLKASDIREDKISSQVEVADIALVVVSQWFLNSPYCEDAQIVSLLQRRRESGMRIYPIIVGPCDWESHEWLRVTMYQPHGKRTVEEHYTRTGKRQRLYLEIFNELKRLGEDIRAGL